MKLTASKGVVLAIIILGVISGVMAELANYVNTTNMSALGIYAPYIVGFVNGVPFILILTLIYNVFIYLNRVYAAQIQQVTENYDTTKLMQTLTLFIGILGPIFALAPANLKAIGALITFLFMAVINEISNVWTKQTPTPPPTAAVAAAAPG